MGARLRGIGDFERIPKEEIRLEIESILCASSLYVLVFLPCLYAIFEGFFKQADRNPSEIFVCLYVDGSSMLTETNPQLKLKTSKAFSLNIL